MKMKTKYLLFVPAILILLACNGNERVYQEKIEFPADVTAFQTGDSICHGSDSPVMKIVVYTDSSGCTGCKLQLDSWKFYMESLSKKYDDKILFMFYLQPHDKDELLFVLDSEEFNYPVYIDVDNQFGTLNALQSDEVFLLDKNDRVLLAGNPLESAKKKAAYEDAINDYLNKK